MQFLSTNAFSCHNNVEIGVSYQNLVKMREQRVDHWFKSWRMSFILRFYLDFKWKLVFLIFFAKVIYRRTGKVDRRGMAFITQKLTVQKSEERLTHETKILI